METPTDLLIYHESAEVLYDLGTVLLRGTPGSVVLLPSNCSISMDILKSGSVTSIGFTRHESEEAPINPTLISTAAPSHLKNRFLHYASLQAQPPTVANQCAQRSEFYGILYELERNTADGNRQTIREEKIRPSVAYMEHHCFDRRMNFKQIAALSGISETYFRTLFTEQYGYTPLRFMIEKKVRKAETMLRETELPFDEILFSCGFQSRSHFVKQFTEIVGISPNEIREK